MRSKSSSILITSVVILSILLSYANPGSLFALSPADYHLLARVTLGGDGFWDYLAIDSQARRLYISRWSHVMVVDADSYRVVGDIPDIHGVHGIAIAPEFGRGFVTEDQ